MKRDGQCISLWQKDMPAYIPQQNNLPHDADIVIVGGGITGISTALALQKEGKRCVVIEAQNIGFGTTGGTTAHLNTLLDTPYYQIKNNFGEKNAKLVAELCQKSIGLIESNVQEYSIDCGFEKKQAYLFSQDKKESDQLEKIVEGTRKVGLPIDYCTTISVPVPFEKAARAEEQAQVHITKYLYGIAKAFEKLGGIIIQDCRAFELTTEN